MPNSMMPNGIILFGITSRSSIHGVVAVDLYYRHPHGLATCVGQLRPDLLIRHERLLSDTILSDLGAKSKGGTSVNLERHGSLEGTAQKRRKKSRCTISGLRVSPVAPLERS